MLLHECLVLQFLLPQLLARLIVLDMLVAEVGRVPELGVVLQPLFGSPAIGLVGPLFLPSGQALIRIVLPLMAPALVAVGTYALLLAWNEYLYQFLLLSSKQSMSVPVALAQFLNSDEAPWNYMMATAIVYAIPPVAIYYVFRRRMSAGLTMGGVKG